MDITELFTQEIFNQATSLIDQQAVLLENYDELQINGKVFLDEPHSFTVLYEDINNGKYANDDSEEALMAAALYFAYRIEEFQEMMYHVVQSLSEDQAKEALFNILKDHPDYLNSYIKEMDLETIYDEELEGRQADLVELMNEESYEMAYNTIALMMDDLERYYTDHEIIVHYMQICADFLLDLLNDATFLQEEVKEFINEKQSVLEKYTDFFEYYHRI